MGVKALRLPEGTYTFSFHANADREGQAGYIAVNAVTDGWPAVLRRRAKNEIKLSTEWKRFSYTFHADGKKLYSPYFKLVLKLRLIKISWNNSRMNSFKTS